MAIQDYLSMPEKRLKQLADSGNAEAMAALGWNYYHSVYKDSDVDSDIAYKYLSAAYKKGCKTFCGIIGEILYFQQVDISGFKEEDYYKLAYKLYQESSKMGRIEGKRGIAKMYMMGDFLDEDEDKARKLLASLKDIDEQSAFIYENFDAFFSGDEEMISTSSFHSDTPDEEEEEEYDEEYDEEEEELSFEEMIDQWVEDPGEIDYDPQGKEYYLTEKQLIEQDEAGNIKATEVLGYVLYTGAFGYVDYERAYDYLVKAYNDDQNTHCGILGDLIYFRKVEISGFSDEDYKQRAYSMFVESMELGSPEGPRGIAKMLLKGDYLDKDVNRAKAILNVLGEGDEESRSILKNFDEIIAGRRGVDPSSAFLGEDQEEWWEGIEAGEENNYQRIWNWLKLDKPEEHGFSVDIDLGILCEDLDEEYDIVDSLDPLNYRYYSAEELSTVKSVEDLLMAVIHSDNNAIELLTELARYYREKGLMSYALYWAQKAVILSDKLWKRSGAPDYAMEVYFEANVELGHCYFSHSDDGQSLPDMIKAAHYYKEGCDNFWAGRAYIGLGEYEEAENQFNTYGACSKYCESKANAWIGQMYFIKEEEEKAVRYWDKSIAGISGWGEYFKGRYLWGRQKKYGEAIDLWQQGVDKGCIECNTELFNWIVDYSNTSDNEKMGMYKNLRMYAYEGSLKAGYHHLHQNLLVNNIQLDEATREYDMMEFVRQGLNNFCPYCANIRRSELVYQGWTKDALYYERLMNLWGFDYNDY